MTLSLYVSESKDKKGMFCLSAFLFLITCLGFDPSAYFTYPLASSSSRNLDALV